LRPRIFTTLPARALFFLNDIDYSFFLHPAYCNQSA
jgi:hypothetical protein